jgi:hypothetical protein
MSKSIEEVMQFLENYTLAWHHWLLVLSLLKLGGCGKKGQIMPVYKKEGFSPHAIERVFRSDLRDLGSAVDVEGDIDNMNSNTMIYLSEDPRLRRFIKKNLKSVVRTLKKQSPK